MKCMNRNKRTFYYALYKGTKPYIDEYGNETSEHIVMYGNPKKCKANISGAKGDIYVQEFGVNESYDKVIVMDDVNTQIDEYSILWVDVIPQIDEKGETNTPHDYIVKKVAKTLNSVSLAISKVNVSE